MGIRTQLATLISECPAHHSVTTPCMFRVFHAVSATGGGGIFHNRNTLNCGALPCWKSGHWGTEQTYGLSTRTCNHRPWLTIMLSHKRKMGVFNFHFYRQITPLCSQFVPKGELGTCINRVTDPCYQSERGGGVGGIFGSIFSFNMIEGCESELPLFTELKMLDPLSRYRVSRVAKMAVFHSYPS